MNRIFTEAEAKSLEDRIKGSRKDITGIFSARVKPKIIEMLKVWLPIKNKLEKIIKNKRGDMALLETFFIFLFIIIAFLNLVYWTKYWGGC